jgi:hypothetical protein
MLCTTFQTEKERMASLSELVKQDYDEELAVIKETALADSLWCGLNVYRDVGIFAGLWETMEEIQLRVRSGFSDRCSIRLSGVGAP